MFKRLATTLNRLVAYLFTAPSLQTETKHSSTASNLPVKSGQPCKDVQEQLSLNQPVQSKPKRKPKAAQQTKQASSRKQTPNPVLAVLGQGGLQRQIRASKTSLPVKPAVKAKAARVPSIKAALLSQLEQAVAQTRTDLQCGERGQLKTRASKTPQAAKAAPTKKPKAVASTTQAKKRTAKQTPAQTRTARLSKARGS